MIYLFLGVDRAAKDSKTAELKTQYLSCVNAAAFDYEQLYSERLDPATLKKALIALPAAAPQRLVVIRAAEKLSAQNQKILLEAAREDYPFLVLIIDADLTGRKNGFWTELSALAQVLRFGREETPENVFDMTKAVERKDPAKAIEVLARLVEDGNHPLQVMGGLVWFWGTMKKRLPAARFQQGLLALQEADLNIKRSRLKPEYAVEVAVAKLSLLIHPGV